MKDDGDDEAVSHSKPRMGFMFNWDINAMIIVVRMCCPMRCYSNAGIFLPSSSSTPAFENEQHVRAYAYSYVSGAVPTFRPFLKLRGCNKGFPLESSQPPRAQSHMPQGWAPREIPTAKSFVGRIANCTEENRLIFTCI